jgi:hypothetical protein
MRVLVLVRRRGDVAHLFDGWRDILPDAVYRLRPAPVIMVSRDPELIIKFSEYDDSLRGTVWDVIDSREIEPVAEPRADYQGFLRYMAETRLAGSKEQLMPLEVAWHLALVNGLQCDWGGCNADAVAARYEKTQKAWLPVCESHMVGPVSATSHSTAAAE